MNWELTKIIRHEVFFGMETMVVKGINKTVFPGQSFLIQAVGDYKISQTVMVKRHGDLLWLPQDKHREIGSQLNIKGPFGKGFSIDPLAKNILLLNGNETGPALMPLMDDAIKKKLNIAYIGEQESFDFPSEIEMLPEKEFLDAYQWAERCYVEVSSENKNSLINRFRQIVFHDKKTEVYLHTPVLCSGNADCMICSVETKSGFVKTCKDGNVFWLSDLEVD